jgi:hypothetical protein
MKKQYATEDIIMPLQDILTRHEDLRRSTYHHEILVRGSDFEACRQRVLDFFKKYQLVSYSQMTVIENHCLPSSHPNFAVRLKEAIQKNRQILQDLIGELQSEGVNTLHDLKDLPQGYKSKMHHVIAHFLDGFFGIDTYFYNLEEDSHWVSREFQQKIQAMPSNHWIISIEAKI